MPKTYLFSLEKNLFFIGWMLIGTGIVCNEWVLKKALSTDGVLEIENRVAIWLFDITFISTGLLLIKGKKFINTQKVILHLSRSYPRTLAFSIGAVLTTILLFYVEVIFYGLNNYRKENIVRETSWIRSRFTHEDELFGDKPLQRVRGGVIEDELLGYKLPQDSQISEVKKREGKVIYNVTYSTDAYGRRITPIENLEQRIYFMFFFGCSMTFGQGVNDRETMPFYVSQYASKYRPYNYGVFGYGPQEMLAKLQSNDLEKEINEKHGILIYTFIDHHIDRTIGTMYVYNEWGKYMPFYAIDKNDRVVRIGNFTSGRPVLSLLYRIMSKSQILKYYNITFPTWIREDHIRLTARITEESRNAFKRQFQSSDFYVLFYPGVKRGKEMIPYFEHVGVKYLDYSSLIDWPQKGFTIEGDPHPTAKGHRTVAARLVKDLGIVDGDKER